MKKSTFLFVLLITGLPSLAQQSVGLRVGDPFGISYKNYFSDNKAFEVGIGTSPLSWHDNYFRNTFKDLDRYEGYRYRDHTVNSSVHLMSRLLLRHDIFVEGMVGDWEWYWGLGGALRMSRVHYTFEGDDPPFFRSDTRTDIDFGPEAMLGMEYTFEDVPLTVFGEFSFLVELVDRPLALQGFSGIGVRYRFR